MKAKLLFRVKPANLKSKKHLAPKKRTVNLKVRRNTQVRRRRTRRKRRRTRRMISRLKNLSKSIRTETKRNSKSYKNTWRSRMKMRDR